MAQLNHGELQGFLLRALVNCLWCCENQNRFSLLKGVLWTDISVNCTRLATVIILDTK